MACGHVRRRGAPQARPLNHRTHVHATKLGLRWPLTRPLDSNIRKPTPQSAPLTAPRCRGAFAFP